MDAATKIELDRIRRSILRLPPGQFSDAIKDHGAEYAQSHALEHIAFSLWRIAEALEAGRAPTIPTAKIDDLKG